MNFRKGNAMDLEALAAALYQAEHSGVAIPALSASHPLKIEDAYQIQLINVQKKLAKGRQITGKKIGLTSKAMQESLGVGQPDFGFLLDDMQLTGASLPAGAVMQPRVEGELAFVLKAPLAGKVSMEDVLAATDYVVPAIEIVGSRVKDWKISITDTIADNASCGMYLLSDLHLDPSQVDLAAVELEIRRNGEQVNSGLGSAVLGHPARPVAWLAETLNQFGVSLDAGDVILSGALSAAVPAQSGDCFECEFRGLTTLKLCFE